MSILKFDGQTSWFVTPDNKYGLSKYPVKNITNDNFSFLAEIDVNWDKMNPNDLTREGGVVIKNGLHMGLTVVKPKENEKYIKGTIWTTDESFGESGLRNYDVFLKVDSNKSENSETYKIGFSYNKEEKEFSIYCNGNWESNKFEGTLVDYSNAWLWFGASNPLESCPIDFKQFFYGEMYFASVFSKSLNKEEFDEVYNNKNNISNELNAVCCFDFQTQTPYKILDISCVGNNLIKFDKTWMDSI